MRFLSDESGALGLGLLNLGLCCFKQNVGVSGTLSATYSPTLTFSASGSISPGGELAAVYTPNLTFAGVGSVLVQGTLDATYSPTLTFAASGAVGNDLAISGTLDATYSPTLTAAFSGAVLVQGTVAATYSPTYTFAGSGSPIPVIDSLTFTDNNDGTPASLALSYVGDTTGYRVYLATGGASISVSAAQLYAGSGGTDTTEFDDAAIGTDIDLTGFTSSSDGAVRIAAALIKSADGSDASDVSIVTTSGLDFTAPTFSSAEVGNIDADTLEITASETLFGTVDYTDFTLTGNTITAASLSGGKIRLTLGTTATSGDDYTGDLSYDGTGSALTDADGNALATFTSQNVTNNVSGGSVVFEVIDQGAGTGGVTAVASNFTTRTWTINIGTADASREVVVVPITYDATTTTITSVNETSSGGTAFSVVSDGVTSATYDSVGASRCGLGAYYLGVSSGTTMDVYTAFSGSISRGSLLVLRKVGGSFQNVSTDEQATTVDLSTSVTVAVGDKLLVVTNLDDSGLPTANITGMDGTPVDWSSDQTLGQYVIDTVGTATTRSIGENSGAVRSRLLTINVR